MKYKVQFRSYWWTSSYPVGQWRLVTPRGRVYYERPEASIILGSGTLADYINRKGQFHLPPDFRPAWTTRGKWIDVEIPADLYTRLVRLAKKERRKEAQCSTQKC